MIIKFFAFSNYVGVPIFLINKQHACTIFVQQYYTSTLHKLFKVYNNLLSKLAILLKDNGTFYACITYMQQTSYHKNTCTP